ncbi:MAG: hypothetical protein HYT20_03015 [Candidatus Nealsonbacteria bacterium]|nr:hypothetical protein [Candidatus Nealsonbacteria bacterium]
MELVAILKTVVHRLEKIKIPYVLTGGLAVSFWGSSRSTHDIDIVIDARKEDQEKILNIFKKDFYISEIAVSDAIERRFTFNIIHLKEGLKVDFWLSKKDSFRTMEFKRRLKKKIFDKYIYIISPEDLILEKLLWIKESRSDKHIEDIKSIIEISKPDLNYIKGWAKKTSTYDILEEIIDK